MEGRITFYAYGSSIELNGKLFTAGELTTDLFNLSAGRCQPMHQRLGQIEKLAEDCMRTRERTDAPSAKVVYQRIKMDTKTRLSKYPFWRPLFLCIKIHQSQKNILKRHIQGDIL